MPPTAPCLAQSESKRRFFQRLGLDERKKLHRILYANMKQEAVDGWSRISANRDALIPQLRNDPAVEPPYTFGQIDEHAIHAEILYIFTHARKDTKIMYRLGCDHDRNHEENWIIRWLLWHVFRYRDERNVGSARKRVLEEESEDPVTAKSATAPSSSAPAHSHLPLSHLSDPITLSLSLSPPHLNPRLHLSPYPPPPLPPHHQHHQHHHPPLPLPIPSLPSTHPHATAIANATATLHAAGHMQHLALLTPDSTPTPAPSLVPTLEESPGSSIAAHSRPPSTPPWHCLTSNPSTLCSQGVPALHPPVPKGQDAQNTRFFDPVRDAFIA